MEKSAINSGVYDLFNHHLLIVWNPEYNLGIPIIDEQHRGIVTVINSLFYAMQNNHGENVLKPTIDIVTEYTHVHFETEEAFLRKYGFPNYKEHFKLHDELRYTLPSVGSKSLWEHNPQKFLEFLKSWWIEHICEKDKIFRDYLRGII